MPSSAAVAILAAIGVALESAPAATQVRAANCVALGTPNPSLTYTYVRTERATSVDYSTQWEEVTATGSRQRTTRAGRGGGTSNNVSRHRVENDVSIIQARGTFSAKSDAGELKILGVNERVTVPAGTFDAIHYTRTTTSARGTIVDEYWKSIEHGVTVKHQSTLLGTFTTEVLQSIR